MLVSDDPSLTSASTRTYVGTVGSVGRLLNSMPGFIHGVRTSEGGGPLAGHACVSLSIASLVDG